MPGLVGLITKKPREWTEPQLRHMTETLRHESSYVTGAWIEESLGLYVGWATRSGPSSDSVPIRNERGDVLLAFSGDEFPDPRIGDRLKQDGHAVEAEGHSYLVHMYEEDPSFPAGLNGWFHGLLVDRTRETATLFNDRYGLHRIYYYETHEAFYFAAEAKAILAVRPELRRLDCRGLGEFISCGCVLENRTLFEGIQVLPPGSAWSFRNSSVQRKTNYFEPRTWEQQAQLEPEEWYLELREVFTRNLPRYFKSQQRIAMSLTGGLDGRVIMAWHKAPPGSLPCYTFGGTYRECRDVTVGRQVATACGQPHQVITVGNEFLSHFRNYAERSIYLSDGCVEVNRAADLYANENIREIAPVRITGNYGSEVLRSNRAFKPEAPLPGLFRRELTPYFRLAETTYNQFAQCHPVTFAAFYQAPWHHYGLLALEKTQLLQRSPYLDNDLVKAVYRAPHSALIDSNASLRLIGDGNPALLHIHTDRGLGDGYNRLGAKMSRGFLEFTFKAEYAYDYGMPQWLARIDHLLAHAHPERIFLGRHKFCHFRVWYRDALANYIREILLDRRTLSRPYLEPHTLERIVQAHVHGERNYTTEIHKVLSLELLHRSLLDPGCRLPSSVAPNRLELEQTTDLIRNERCA
jgi:asparagine synthase (glutamine-hydrolysing)